MATYYADTYLGPNAFSQEPHHGHRVIVGKVVIPAGTAPATGDVLKLARIGSGAFFRKIYIWNSDWGTTVPVSKLGLATQDDDAIVENSTNTLALGNAHATTPVIFVNDDATSAGAVAATTFVTALTGTSAADTLQITLGTVSGGTSAGEKTLTFAAEIIDFGSARSGDLAYTYNGLSSLVAGVSS